MAKKPIIKYTNREFDSIKGDLIEYAKRYYPTSFKDFNESSFGALMLDTVAYVGDVLSFYLDYQANEQFLSTAVEYGNVVKLAKQHGYRWSKVPTSTGFCTFFVLLPTATGGGIDERYAPILKKGSQVGSTTGASFMLAEDVNFGELGLETVVAKVDSDSGQPTHYARKSYGRIISGKVKNKTVSVGDFQRYRKVQVGDNNIAEIIGVIDSDGHEYFEVEYLTQNIIYRPITNNNTDKKAAPFVLKPFPAPRRFTVETIEDGTYLRFGFGSEANLSSDQIVDPSKIVLDLYGKNYSVDEAFDPFKLLNNDKMGVSPSNTTLVIRYRQNDPTLANVGAGAISAVTRRLVSFNSTDPLNADTKKEVRTSIEVENDEPILGDVSEPDAEEVRLRALSMFASQNRAVTKQDYVALIYSMDKRFGAIKRCDINKDLDSFKNNLNLYVVSEDENGFLTETNSTIKQNLKTWLSRYRMIGDTVDILDARIVNFGIDFEIVTSLEFNKFEVLESCLSRLKFMFSINHFELGESIKINDIYNELSSTRGVVDVSDLKVFQKTTAGYEQTQFKFDTFRSPDGRYVIAPEGLIFELRYPSLDIRGATK